jgi:acyl dehydratase
MTLSYKPHYWEDYEIGQTFESPGRTITDADLVNHSALSGDWTEIHTNEEYAKRTSFGGRIAHGPLTFTVATGLMVRMGILERTVRAFLGMNYMDIKKPVYAGDTLYLTLEVKNKRELESKDNEALVVLEATIENQDDESVLEGDLKFLIGKKESEDEQLLR